MAQFKPNEDEILIKIYDFLGNLTFKDIVNISIYDEDIYGLPHLIKDQKILMKLLKGFQFYSASQEMWIKVEKNVNLSNVIIMKSDFKDAKILSI